MKYRQKPVEVEVIFWDGSNTRDVMDFCCADRNSVTYSMEHENSVCHSRRIFIETYHGDLTVHVGDCIVRNAEGEIHLYSHRVFDDLYEAVEGKD